MTTQEKSPCIAETRTTPDTLTVAYVAIGAIDALDRDGERPIREQKYNADDWDGQMGFIEAVTNHALLLDQLADLVDEQGGFNGVFLYEVAQEFGEQFGLALLDDRSANPRPLAERLIKDLQA